MNRLATLACSARKRQMGRGEEGEVLSDGCELSGTPKLISLKDGL